MVSNGATYYGNPAQGIISKEGKYTIKLIAQKGKCIDTIYREGYITVSKPDAEYISARNVGCMPAIFNFQDSSTSAYSPIVKYNWTVPGVGNSTIQNPTFTFTREGVFPVKLAIVNEMGCKDSIVKQISVFKAKADFNVDKNNVCAGTNITFNNNSTGSNLTYSWDFGDGTTSTDTTPVHFYSKEKNYTVKLVVRDQSGCVDSIVKVDYVKIQNIHVDFTASPRFKSCPDLITNFQLQNPNNRYNLSSIQWDFGNGNTSNDGNVAPQGVYTQSDSFTIKLMVRDTKGCVDTVIKPNYVVVSGPDGSLTFSPDTGCLPVEVTFNATFHNTTTTIWDFGDGTTITDRSLATTRKYTYKREGEFTPSLVLKDDFGCNVNIVSKKKIALSRLYAKLTPDKTLLCSGNGKIELKDSVYSSFNAPITKHVWKIYDDSMKVVGTNVTNFSPGRPGKYFVNYEVQSLLGCAVKDTFSLYVYNKPAIAASDDKVICKGEQIELIVNGPQHLEWSPTYALNTTNPFYVTARPDSTTKYVIKGYDHPACPAFDTVTVNVRTKIKATAWPDTTICVSDSVLLHVLAENTSLNVSKITWAPDPSLALISANICGCEVWAYPKQNTTYRVTVTNGACTPLVLPVTVAVTPTPTVTAGDDKMGIRGMEFALDASSPDIVQYTWAPDYKLSCTDCQSPVATPDVDTTYEVTAINQYGCKSKDYLRVRVIEDCEGKMVYLPNTFTPNGDGINESLKVMGPGVASVKRFRVFNRWGQMIFESTDPAAGWDGTFNGTKLDPGVYMYYVDVECIDGRKTMKKGDVTLLR
jgi:gliding motility-associated-like protein